METVPRHQEYMDCLRDPDDHIVPEGAGSLPGLRGGYLGGGDNSRQEMPPSGPVLFVRHARHTEQGIVRP